ncbi:hypothetical protein A3K63_03170 [Candidatus Micrarchaeota archaeon RBG_16_49_10]|nr:MAG: hypothetical protein A3K63_03170 [Candidatus Micrarchaeota archaeon RBG_16_49_10]
MRLTSDGKTEAFLAEAEKKGVDSSVFLSYEPVFDSNIEYFTGFRQERAHASACLLVEEGGMTLLVSKLEYDRALNELKGVDVVSKKEYGNSLLKFLKARLKGKKRIGVNENIFPYRVYRKFSSRKFLDVSEIAYNLRSVKEAREIKALSKATRITNIGIKFIEDNISLGVSERELSLQLEQEVMRKGVEGFSFPPIIKSGASSAYIHPYPSVSERKIGRGLGMIDFGVICDGYCSDTTIPLKIGKLNKKEEAIADTVEEAYRKSIDALRVGEPTWKIFEVAENVIKGGGFEFKHSLGHGIGLDVHEFPNLSPRPEKKKELKKWKEETLRGNMVFTIEPGIYEPGIGGYRLENDIILTKKGPEILTNAKTLEL